VCLLFKQAPLADDLQAFCCGAAAVIAVCVERQVACSVCLSAWLWCVYSWGITGQQMAVLWCRRRSC
jgi:hypothetical protein